MKRRLIPVVVLIVAVLALASCSSDPQAQLRGDVERVIATANDEDAGALRGAAQDLLSTISKLGGTGKLASARESELRQLTLAVLANAGLLDAEPSPSPVQTSEAPSPSPSPSPSPEPSVEPSPSPEPSKKPKGKPSPSPSDDPVIVIPLDPSPTAETGSAEPSPASSAPA